MSKDYCIYNGYTSRTEFTTCEQIGHTDQFQDEVYAAARKLCVENNYKTVLDIGCGSAFKLIKYFRDKKFVGLDLEPNLSHIKDKYPLYDFRESDFTNPPVESYDLIIDARERKDPTIAKKFWMGCRDKWPTTQYNAH